MYIKELKKHYRDLINKYHLHPREAVIGAGAACMLYGIREQTNDIDIDVSEKFFNMVSMKYKPEVVYDVPDNGSIRKARVIPEFMDVFDLHILEPSIEFTTYEGIGVYTLEQLLKQKLLMNREKDQKDIAAIKRLLDKH